GDAVSGHAEVGDFFRVARCPHLEVGPQPGAPRCGVELGEQLGDFVVDGGALVRQAGMGSGDFAAGDEFPTAGERRLVGVLTFGGVRGEYRARRGQCSGGRGTEHERTSGRAEIHGHNLHRSLISLVSSIGSLGLADGRPVCASANRADSFTSDAGPGFTRPPPRVGGGIGTGSPEGCTPPSYRMRHSADAHPHRARQAGRMSLALAGPLVVLALIDSTSIGTLVLPIWLMLQRGRLLAGRITAFLLVVALFYWVMGLVLLAGAVTFGEGISEFVMSTPGAWARLIVGIVLFVASW